MLTAFDPLKFFNLAQELAKEEGDEAKLRTAVGRAYYALFLFAKEKTGARGNHEQIIMTIKRRSGYKATGDQLGALHRLRIVADYQVVPIEEENKDWKDNWEKAQLLSERILPKLQTW